MLINLGIEPSNVLNILPWNNGLVYVCEKMIDVPSIYCSLKRQCWFTMKLWASLFSNKPV